MRTAGLLVAGFLAVAVASVGHSAAQRQTPSPDDLPPTHLVPNVAAWAVVRAEEGAVVHGYDGINTEIRVKIVPVSEGPGENPTTFYFSAVFPGRRLRTTPDRVWVRAQSNLNVEVSRLRTPTLAITANGNTLLQVMDPGPSDPAWLNYPCDLGPGCTFDGIVAGMPIIQFFRLLEADRAFGEALGFPFSITKEDLRMLEAFAKELVPRDY